MVLIAQSGPKNELGKTPFNSILTLHSQLLIPLLDGDHFSSWKGGICRKAELVPTDSDHYSKCGLYQEVRGTTSQLL